MLGAITGDVVGSVYEWNNIKYKDFDPLFSADALFTDDCSGLTNCNGAIF
ncbi:MAG: ADP-ribosylglycohydrolase [Candidatus Thioglobus sp.]|jgi:ADP-ribosylglycohydrolase|nr:ADP-ribosylglycohydrolase [Candidatus Thioglobus sp.]